MIADGDPLVAGTQINTAIKVNVIPDPNAFGLLYVDARVKGYMLAHGLELRDIKLWHTATPWYEPM